MGLKVAVQSGNWSNTSTWENGIIPGVNDVVSPNGFQVTIDQNIEVDSLYVGPYSTDIIPEFEGETHPDVVLEYSGYGSPYYPWYAFSSILGSYWQVSANNWATIEFTEPKLVNAVYHNSDNNRIGHFRFEGWNGTDWDILYEESGISAYPYFSGKFNNTTAYSKYRYYIVGMYNTSYARVNSIRFFNIDTDSSVTASGSFVFQDDITVTCNNDRKGIYRETAVGNFLTYTGTSFLNINASFWNKNSANSTYFFDLNAEGTVNIIGDIVSTYGSSSLYTGIYKRNTGTMNIVGSIYNYGVGNISLFINEGEVNLTGNIQTGLLGYNIYTGNNGFYTTRINSLGIFNITGNVYMYLEYTQRDTWSSVYINGGQCYITGELFSYVGTTGNNNYTNNNAVRNLNNGTLNCIGKIECSGVTNALNSTGREDKNLVTGPFISSREGFTPISCSRLHIIPTGTCYYEFRDSSTNGYNPPDALNFPNTISLLSPSLTADAPQTSDVRKGIVYAQGTQVGTLEIPSPEQVSYGTPVDNTVGTAVLTPEDIWNAQTSAMNTDGSIGKRLKNASTVNSTGDQLSSLL